VNTAGDSKVDDMSDWTSLKGTKSPSSARSTVFWILVSAIGVWTFYELVGGLSFSLSLSYDLTGETAWHVVRAVYGDNVENKASFIKLWADPSERNAFLVSFETTFWWTRLMYWGVPSVVLGIVALCVKPAGGTSSV
jgi:hypothetical protein